MRTKISFSRSETLDESTNVEGQKEVTTDEAADIFSIQGSTAMPAEASSSAFLKDMNDKADKQRKAEEKARALEEKKQEMARLKAEKERAGTEGSVEVEVVAADAKARLYMDHCLKEPVGGTIFARYVRVSFVSYNI